jgi:hypothetical protein
MPAESTQFKGTLKPYAARHSVGPMVLNEGTSPNYKLGNACYFVAQADHTVSGAGATTSLIADIDVPAGLRCYVTRFDLSVNGANAWTGGTGVGLRDTAAVQLAEVAVAQLTANASYFLPDNGTTTGLTDVAVKQKLSTSTVGKGLNIYNNGALAAGASTPIRVYIEGYFAP